MKVYKQRVTLRAQQTYKAFTQDPREHQARRRSGLKAADKGDLKPLQNLVLECFQQQPADVSSLPKVNGGSSKARW